MMLGIYLWEAAPASMQDKARATDEFEKASRKGLTVLAPLVAQTYLTGEIKEKDLGCAYAFYFRSQHLDPSRAASILTEIEQQIGSSGLARARKIIEELNPVKPVLPVPQADGSVKPGYNPDLLRESACKTVRY
jgi:hypothetical protein